VDEVNPIPITAHIPRALHRRPLTPTLYDPIRLVYPSRANPRQDLDQENPTRIVAHQRHPCNHAIISLIWRIPVAPVPHPPRPVTVCRSIPRLSSAISVRSALPVHTICDPIYERTPTSDLSSALSVGRLLPANMTANGMKDSIAARKGSSAEENSDREDSGAVAENLRVPMRWADTSDLRPEEFASNRFSTRRQPKERGIK
jgi:hypothetical protein